MQNTTQDTTNSTQVNVEPHREKATERQINAISYHLWQAGYNENAHYVSKIMTRYEAHKILDRLMASDYKGGIEKLEQFSNNYK